MGLRFDKRDARRLLAFAEGLLNSRAADTEDVALFDKAAIAAAQGEPLHVICADPEEAKRMAQGFVRYGFLLPSVELISESQGGDPLPAGAGDR